MSLFGGVKQKLGFGDEPEWQDDVYDDGYEDEYYDDEVLEDDEGIVSVPRSSRSAASAVTFDDYNPDSFEHVRVSTDRELEVASYGNSRDSYFAKRTAGNASYASGIGTSASRRASNVRSFNDRPRSRDGWGPSDPSFLDGESSSSLTQDARAVLDAAMSGSVAGGSATADPYSQFDSDVKRIARDPSARMEVVRPHAYSDVEKIASAFKAGKSVVLSLRETKPDLAKRILDFSFGVASALNGTVDKAADKVFVITKGDALTMSEKDYLRKQGVL